jgi:hypothetical protein
MAANEHGPTLTDAVGMGGVIAQEGFDYQVWTGLVRLPAWLTNPGFEALIFEGLEDIEARFFAPHAPEHHLLERLQAKSGDLSQKDISEVFERFRVFESKHPRVTRIHTLVTPQLRPTLKWVARDAARVRRARPFYAPFVGIRAASDGKLAEEFIKEFGDELGRFVAEEVEVTEQPMPSREAALHAFSAALAASFSTTDLGQRQVKAAFDALEALARRSSGVPLVRKELLDRLESETSSTLLVERAFPVHVRSDRNGDNEAALEIDASAFSGGPAGFPPAERWRAELVATLDTTADWLRRRGVSRVALSGSYRLTTAFLLGHAFRSASGFELEIPTREGAWATDDRATEDANDWSIIQPPEIDGETLVVSVGVIRRPSDDLKAGGVRTERVLDVFKSSALTDAKLAQAGAARVKAAVTEASSRLRARRIHLYYAGPAAFAVALGHRWNAMLPTNLFEFDSTNQIYVPTASLG